MAETIAARFLGIAFLPLHREQGQVRQIERARGYCQVEGFKADSTARYGRRRIFAPPDIGARFANLTVPAACQERLERGGVGARGVFLGEL